MKVRQKKEKLHREVPLTLTLISLFLSCLVGGIMRQHQGYIGLLAPLCILFIFLLFTLTASYKPIIVVHGLFDSPSDFRQLLVFINETHPGTNVTVIDLFDHTESLKPLWMQVEGFRQAIYPIMQNAVDGVHLICYSQGM
nr:lysosomal thioesterase PPT2-A-like [Zootoca vivipara]